MLFSTGFDRDEKYAVQLSTEERHSWIWCLLFIFFVPELLSLFRSARLCIFKQYQKPKISSFMIVFIVESLQVIGLVILVFVVFPRIDVMVALSLTNAVCILPSFLNVFSSWNSQNSAKAWVNNALNLFAVLAQASIFIWIAANSKSKTSVEIFSVVSVILVSFTWWENFVGSNFPKCLNSVKEDIDNSRHFIYVFISVWKIILIFLSFLIYLFSTGEDLKIFLKGLPESFTRHNLSVAWPEIDGHNIPTTLQPPSSLPLLNERTQVFLPLIVAGIHMLASFLCFSCGKFVCKICIQGFSYALPVLLSVPSTMILLDVFCKNECVFKKILTKYHFWKCSEHQSDFFAEGTGFFWILWLTSQVWITIYLWNPQSERMAATNKLFVNPLYCTILIDQSLALNRRRNEKIDSETHTRLENDETEIQAEDVPRIFACATMWHETPDEMEQLLKSIMRMDVHQCSQKTIQDGLVIRNPDYYEIEAYGRRRLLQRRRLQHRRDCSKLEGSAKKVNGFKTAVQSTRVLKSTRKTCCSHAEAWDSLERQSLKNAGNKLWPDLEGEKDFDDDHREEITDFLQSIPGFQECDEDVETWMACDAEDCGFQMLNDDEIVASEQEESDPGDDETDKDEDNNNNESSKGPSNADAFSLLETTMEWYE
ncbi:chitin synthase chs-2 [Trichonephila clavipes]|nr:chitin synthase chs-2 [Trichonephila clavipes]